jgi:hypothetical protein
MLGFRISTVVNDDNWYNFIKLFAALSVKLGYSGLLLFIDECVNLYKIPNRISREANYEKILTIFNDTLQGRARNLGVIFGGTPQFLEDTRRGLFSYDALKSRLEDSKYSELGYQNLSSPVIRLRRLSDNELLALVKRLAKLYAQREGSNTLPVTDSEIEIFMSNALARAGAEELITPREIIRDFLTVLNVMKDNPGVGNGNPINHCITEPYSLDVFKTGHNSTSSVKESLIPSEIGERRQEVSTIADQITPVAPEVIGVGIAPFVDNQKVSISLTALDKVQVNHHRNKFGHQGFHGISLIQNIHVRAVTSNSSTILLG